MKLSTFSESIQNLQKVHYGDQLRPVRDWFVLIVVTLVVLGSGAILNVLEFKNIISNKITTPSPVSHSSALNGAAMQKVQDIFTARANRQAKYESGDYSFTDPSK